MSGADQPGGIDAQLWSRPQHAVAYQEARAVLNAQQQRKNNLDDKALRTTRLITVIVGAVITAVKALNVTVNGVGGVVGIALLVVAFGGSLVVYSFSSPILGPGDNDLRRLVWMEETAWMETEKWEQNFILQMGAWIRTNKQRLNRSAILLFVSDITLFGGVGALVLAIGL
jgi:hypothetical protein